MIDKLLGFLNSKRTLKISFVFFFSVYIILIITYNFLYHFLEINDGDNYILRFQNFLDVGYYESVSKGTSPIYNVALKGIYSFTRNINESFIIVNLVSQLLLIYIGYLFFKTFKRSFYTTILFVMYVLYVMNAKYFLSTYNDHFLGVFLSLILYFLMRLLFHSKQNFLAFGIIGFLFSIAISIRMTGFFILPLILIAFIFWARKNQFTFKNKSFRFLTTVLVFFITTLLIHYPALIEKKGLSFENKNPKNFSVNWNQRNFLALNKAIYGTSKFHRDVIWKETKFEEVQSYVAKNGEDSLPKTTFGFIFKDPMIFLTIGSYNLLFCVLRFFRFWGFLFLVLFLPFIKIIKQKRFEETAVFSYMFVFISILISFICFTFIEFRWFEGYEILIPFSVAFWIKEAKWNYFNLLFSVSLIVITLFNVKSIISY